MAKKKRPVYAPIIRKATLDLLVDSAKNDHRFEGLSEAFIRSWAVERVAGFLATGQFPWWYGQLESDQPVVKRELTPARAAALVKANEARKEIRAIRARS